MYQYNIKHVPGVSNKGPDALSRYPVSIAPQSSDIEEKIHSTVSAISQSDDEYNAFQAITWERIEESTLADPVLQTLITHIVSGFPDRKQEIPNEMHPFWDVRHNFLC